MGSGLKNTLVTCIGLVDGAGKYETHLYPYTPDKIFIEHRQTE